ncbi:L,D-transpeptidase [Hartmannibacter diazotrophicus]|nr:L,D-transpeptidase [Hartmannibacter diazotrophicus]
MKNFRLFLAAAAMAATFAPAHAASVRYATPPPVVLSPDAVDPWVLQLRPGQKPIYAAPKAQARATRLPDPRREQRQQANVQPRTVAVTPTRQLAPEFLPTVVDYSGPYKPGTIVIDTEDRHLFLVEQNGRARRYGVGVGRPGFAWAGTHKITRKAEWPGWTPPPEMRQRQPDLPRYMEGGPKNPLGARALYLGSTLYRIHGTSQPWTIGQAVSSGCIRMRNEDVKDLYTRVNVGTKVVVLR